ncbi:acyl-CoA thioesterase [Meiothermus granaticius]|uniref:Putative esterase n=1 Tax=Meiothermus granaticius NBRC 107808 TaxID=1227551 RepID=A0A399F9P2_9DEIN|nr:thioesterase family protein [Meiothermus granaticius]RIH92823.1 putative esterase [Meiothermus granaticius NBRC 107808]GEM85537.1 thioesterase [Meiothermus granaticius NBRC 107808]
MIVRLQITVRYVETDAMGVVHHSAYVPWLEAARVEWLNRMGVPYTEVERQGLAFAVVELGLTYRHPARFGDQVEVETWLEEVSSRALRYRYRVWKEANLLAEGFTRHLCQEASGKAQRIPTDLLNRLKAHSQ